MTTNVSALLDKAKLIHNLPSDYKLALVMGISHNSLASYRHGKTLPDARIIKLLCDLSGDDPALLLAEIEAQRAKTDEARALWLQVVERLQSTLHAAVFAVVFGAIGWGALPSDAAAQSITSIQSDVSIHRGMLARAVRRLFRALASPLVRSISRFFAPRHVSRTPSTAAA